MTLTATPPVGQDGVFDRDLFLLRQKHLAINEKYHVWDEHGETLLYVERPAHLGRNLLATITGVAAGLVVLGFFTSVADSLDQSAARLVLTLVAFVGAAATMVAVYAALARKRHVTFRVGGPTGDKVLEVLQQERVTGFTATFIVREPTGRLLATLRKNYLYDLFRSRWACFGPQGRPMCVAMEDALWKAVLRRLLGPMLGLLRTNFAFVGEPSGNRLGELQRKLTLLDRYVLDLRADPGRRLDRRVALALAVMLDTGQRR